MKFLIDENLSPAMGSLLAEAGHDAVHVRDIDATSTPDSAIFTAAAEDDRIIISADTDFGALLAAARATKPSVILVREIVHLRPAELTGLVLAQLDDVLERHLTLGAAVAITPSGVRVRQLPLR